MLLHASGAFTLVLWIILAWLSRAPAGVGLHALFTTSDAPGSRSDQLVARERRGTPDVVAALWIWGLLFRVAGFFGAPVLEDDWARYLLDGGSSRSPRSLREHAG